MTDTNFTLQNLSNLSWNNNYYVSWKRNRITFNFPSFQDFVFQDRRCGTCPLLFSETNGSRIHWGKTYQWDCKRLDNILMGDLSFTRELFFFFLPNTALNITGDKVRTFKSTVSLWHWHLFRGTNVDGIQIKIIPSSFFILLLILSLLLCHFSIFFCIVHTPVRHSSHLSKPNCLRDTGPAIID